MSKRSEQPRQSKLLARKASSAETRLDLLADAYAGRESGKTPGLALLGLQESAAIADVEGRLRPQLGKHPSEAPGGTDVTAVLGQEPLRFAGKPVSRQAGNNGLPLGSLLLGQVFWRLRPAFLRRSATDAIARAALYRAPRISAPERTLEFREFF